MKYDEDTKIHHVWYAFCDHMKKWYYGLEPFFKKDFTESKGKFRYFDTKDFSGYDAMCRAEKYASKHKEIIVVGCDDAVFASSDIVLVPHEDNDGYWGTTVLFIPQCTTDKGQFFLYPNHLNNLLEVLQKIKEKQDKNPRW